MALLAAASAPSRACVNREASGRLTADVRSDIKRGKSAALHSIENRVSSWSMVYAIDAPIASATLARSALPSIGECSTIDAVTAAMPALSDGCSAKPAGKNTAAPISGVSADVCVATITPLRIVVIDGAGKGPADEGFGARSTAGAAAV